jgi:hypothetical protein
MKVDKSNNNKYKADLVKKIEVWRLRDSDNGRPVGWAPWGEKLGIVHTILWLFCRDGGNNGNSLGPKALHKLAEHAKANGDHETVLALARYALNVDVGGNDV